jgi:hypothetical protein
MIPRRTQLLALIVLLAAGGAAFGWYRMDQQRDAALAAQRDLQHVLRDLEDISGKAAGGQHVTVGRLDSQELSRRVNTAAVAAGILDKLKDVDRLGEPMRLGNTDYSELTVILRFEGTTLQQLTTFLHQLAATDPGSRAKSVELSVPEVGPVSAAGASPGSELWTADVAIAYLLYAPKEAKAPR